MRSFRQWMAFGVCAVSLAGCSDDGADPASQSAATGGSSSSENGGKSPVPPTASIETLAPATAEDADIKVELPKPGSPEDLILQITQLTLKPFPETDDVEQQKAARRERNQKVIELASEAVTKTRKDPAKEQVFNIAVHRLMDATFQLAMQGDQDSVTNLYEFADFLFQERPQSKAASDSAWFVTRYVNENAQRYAAQEPRWLKEFSRQARSFADRFPQERQRAIGLLNDAGASCDYYGLRDEAVLCYEAIRQNFSDTPQAEHVAGPLRRLALVGNKVDLGGPTIDGGFVTVDGLKGAPILVVFWSTQAAPFVEHAAEIISAAHKFEEKGLQVVGVNLDVDEAAIDAFAEKTGMTWQNVFHAEPAKRGWNNPIAAYYGVHTIPQIWLIDAAGIVRSTTIHPKDVESELAKLMDVAKPNPANSKPAVKPAKES